MEARVTLGRLIAFAGGMLLLLSTCEPLAAATYRTRNFEVKAPSAEVARKVGDHAEKCRKLIANAWLGKEIPSWKKRCPVQVKVTDGEAGGVTTFDFNPKGGVIGQAMSVEGRIDRILASALPHEVTHTIFAAYLGGPMPRWADEGASLLSEDLRELTRHDRIVADLLTRRGDFNFSKFFQMEEYPRDLMGFYGQGYSVSRFLVELGGRPRFLEFVRDGMKKGWEDATSKHYGLADLRELERAWHAWYEVTSDDPSRNAKPTSPLVARADIPADPTPR